jgi:hypothetical protein
MAILELISASSYTAGLCEAGGWQAVESFNEFMSLQPNLWLRG